MIQKISDFLREELWRIPTRELSKHKSLAIKQLRIIIIVFRKFLDDKCQLRASALTFYTLLSIVPVIALAIGIAKGFGLERILEREIASRFQGQEEVMRYIFDFSGNLLAQAKGGVMTGIGVFMLFWTVVELLGNIENAFNNIWGIQKARSIGRKFSDYLSVMLVGPILLIFAGSLNVFIIKYLRDVGDFFEVYGFLEPLMGLIAYGLPFIAMWLLLSFMYIFVPNTRVRFSHAIFAGAFAGIMYNLLQWTYITCQIGLSKYNAVYGSFAALPFLIIWIQLSWLIVLFGAELAFATQNIDAYEFEPDFSRMSSGLKFRLTLLILSRVAGNFEKAKEAIPNIVLSNELKIPVRVVNKILLDCAASGLLCEIKTDKNEDACFLPAMDTKNLTIELIAKKMLACGQNSLPLPLNKELTELAQKFDSLFQSLKNSSMNVPVSDIFRDNPRIS
jgi:membrane protein